MQKNKLIKLLVVGFTIILGVALLLFERVNWITTHDSLSAVFGGGEWIVILTWAVVLTDLAALAHIFTPQRGQEEPVIIQVLWIIWGAVSFLDMGLTWYFASIKMEQTNVVAPNDIAAYVWAMPMIVALIVWGVQFAILYIFGKLLEKLVWGSITAPGRSMARSRQMPLGN